jgi:hypothetical protein
MPRDITRKKSPAALDGAQAAARSRRAREVVATMLGAALGWLSFGCLGLLWTIAFTADARSMTIGLAVWVFCFVVPSIVATAVAYRVEERASEEDERPRMPTARRRAMPVGGD